MFDARSVTTRRDFFRNAMFGVGAMALADLLKRDGRLLASTPVAISPAGGIVRPAPHYAARAKHVIHLYLGGGLSHIDSFDYKPELEKFHDKDMPASFGKADPFMGKAGRLHKAHYAFKRRGQSGLWVSDLFPEIATVADELTVINSMVAETANHIPGNYQANTGFRQMGFPSMGAWLSYGLGSENDNLPSFVVLPDARGLPTPGGGAFNWSSGFLPAQHQGVTFNTKGDKPIFDLQPAGGLDAAGQAKRRDLLRRLNEIHLREQTQTDPLAARIRSYELAAGMQQTIPEAMDLNGEPDHVKQLYGLDRDETRDVARNCLAARRLVERGVRMVQIWTGDGTSWDAHDDILARGYKSHSGEALRVDRPIAGLIKDLRQRGLLDQTVVMITTEFGRTPYAQSNAGTISRGRDHHPEGFTNVIAGGGFKGGVAYGSTDAIGYASVEKPVTTYDMHATVLHQLGIDHEKLTFYHNGIERRLTNVHGHVVREILV